jgi:asparagine synthase (glutamine-hydrolysing)
VRRGLHLLAVDDAQRFALLRGFMDRGEARNLYAGELAQAWRSGCDGASMLAERYRSATGSALNRMRIVDIQTYLADCLMPKVDVATMASGLEARAPLLDQEVIRFALSLPDAWISDRDQGKRLLRALLDRYLPASLFDRPKQGFDVPLQDWFTDQLRPRLERLSTSEPLHASGWFRDGAIRALVDEHLTHRRDHTQRIFNLLVLDEWLRHS